jgi:hypothetical protein
VRGSLYARCSDSLNYIEMTAFDVNYVDHSERFARSFPSCVQSGFLTIGAEVKIFQSKIIGVKPWTHHGHNLDTGENSCANW